MEFHSFKQLGESMIRREVDTTPEIVAEARRLRDAGDRDGAKRKLKELRDIVAKLLEWDKRKDADEITDGITDLLADLEERGFIYLMKDVVREGRWFTFIDAPAGLEPQVTRTDAQGVVEKLASSRHMVLPHVPCTTVQIDEVTIEHGDAAAEERPQLAAIWPTVSHFLPEESVTLEVYDPAAAGGSGSITVLSDGQDESKSSEIEITLNSFGRAQHSLGRLGSGEYRASYTPAADGESQTTAFCVGEPKRSSISIRVQRAFIRSDRVAVRLLVNVLGQPFRGRGLLKISDRSTGKPVATISGYVKKGSLDVDFSVRNDYGPFDLRFEKGAEHASTVLPLVRRISASISQPGGSLRVEGGMSATSIDASPSEATRLAAGTGEGGADESAPAAAEFTPWLGMRLVNEETAVGSKPGWVRLGKSTQGNVSLIFEEATGPTAVLIEPATGGERVCIQRDSMTAGESLELPLEAAYATLRVGAFVEDGVREAALLAFRSAPNHASMEMPSRALPGDTIKVRVDHDAPTHSLLVVSSDTRDPLDPYYELASRVVEDVMSREPQLGAITTKPKVIRHGKVTIGGSAKSSAKSAAKGAAKEVAKPKKPTRRASVRGPGRKTVVPPLPTGTFEGDRFSAVYHATFVGQGEFTREVTLPSTEQRWKLTLFSVSPDGFHVVDRYINVRGRSDFQIDLPQYIGTGDRIDGGINYRTTRESALHVIREGKRRSSIVKGAGREPLVISRPTTVEVELYEVPADTTEAPGAAADSPKVVQSASIGLLDHEIGHVVELKMLAAGDDYERPGARVVESIALLIARIAGALDRIPFDHAEIHAARLAATLVMRRLVSEGALPGETSTLDVELGRRWQALAACQVGHVASGHVSSAQGAAGEEGEGLFALSPGRAGDLAMTTQVLQAMVGLRTASANGLDVEKVMPGAIAALNAASRMLVASGVRDARLVPHTSALVREPEAFEEIAAAYLSATDESIKRGLAERIIDPVAGVEVPRWGASVAFGGDDEATARALQVCLLSGHENVFDRGFTAFAAHLVDYRLHSPSATVALIDLLDLYRKRLGDAPAAGSFDISGAPESQRIRALKGRIMIALETEASIPRAPQVEDGVESATVRVQVGADRVRPGDLVTISVFVDPPAPLGYEVTVLLPGILAFREGNEQQIGRFLSTGGRLDLQVIALRTGQGLLRAHAESIATRSLIGSAAPHRLICEVPPPPAHVGGQRGGGARRADGRGRDGGGRGRDADGRGGDAGGRVRDGGGDAAGGDSARGSRPAPTAHAEPQDTSSSTTTEVAVSSGDQES